MFSTWTEVIGCAIVCTSGLFILKILADVIIGWKHGWPFFGDETDEYDWETDPESLDPEENDNGNG
jgi:hypothetical protein